MKLKLLSILLVTIFFNLFETFGQVESPLINNQSEVKPCGQTDILQRLKNNNSHFYREVFNTDITVGKEQNDNIEKSTTVYTIPVVFHVLHNNGSENISEAQILSAISILNRDYRKQNSDVNNVVAQFLPLASDVYIEFALAKIAPNGNCFNGITRTVSPLTVTPPDLINNPGGLQQINAIISGNDVYNGVWPHNKYLNIYVCTDAAGFAGYTFLPSTNSASTAENMYSNGIFMMNSYVGDMGTSSIYNSRILTHEVGHWLNLHHTWGTTNDPGLLSNCGDDDGVTDTPNTIGSTSCNLSENSCGPIANVENYMEYSYCSKMFTAGQVARMRTAVQSSTAGRNNLWKTANLQDVGVLSGGNSVCTAEIDATEKGLCVNETTIFSVTTNATSYSWSFPGGTPSSSTAANPVVSYSSSGWYSVSVTITTSSGTITLQEDDFIAVANGGTTTPVALPIIEGFVGTTFPPTNWSTDFSPASETWHRNSSHGTSPTTGNSMVIDFYTNEVNGSGFILTPSFSLENYISASLSFDVSYKQYSNYSNDRLQIMVKPGCAYLNEIVYQKEGVTLETEHSPNYTVNTTPVVWRRETIDLTPYLGKKNVQIRFQGNSGEDVFFGNNIYIDNVNISGTAGTANFSVSSTTECVGETIVFTNTSTGANSWDWNFGVGATPSTATGAGPHSVTYSNSGVKSVSLSINGGGSATSQTININPQPVISLATFPSVCINGGMVILNQGSPSGGWFNGPGVLGNSFSPVIAGVGDHTITYSLTMNGCTNTTSGQLTVYDLPNVTLSTLPTMCLSDTPINLTQGSPFGGTYSGPGVIGNQFDPSIAGTGVKTITYTYSQNGCTNSATRQLTVDALPVVTLSTLPTTCVNASPVTLTQGSPLGGTYSGLGVSGNQFNPSVTGSGLQTIYYTYSVGSCSNTVSNQIMVDTPPIVTFGSIPDICSNDSPIFLNQGTPAGGTYSGPGVSGNQFDPTLAGLGVQTITYTYNSLSGCVGSATSTITVNPSPNVTIGSIGDMCLADSPVLLTQGNPSGGTFFGPGINSNYFSPSSTGLGTWSITYNYTASNGCINSASSTIVVDGCLGIPEQDGVFLNVYPNPTNGIISVESSEIIDEVIIMDNVGRIVQVCVGNNSNLLELNLEHLATGSYQVQTKIGVNQTSKQIILK